MKAGTIFAAAAVVVAGAAAPAFAQEATFSNQNAASDSVTDLRDQIRDDSRRTVPAFGNSGRRVGWSGSAALRASMSQGNSDTADLGFGARFSYFDGVNGHRFNGSYAIAENAGVRTKDSLQLGYDYTRDFASNIYGFGKINLTYDKFSAYKSDVFVGVGVGYRIFDDGNTQWAIQAGPGYREARDNNDVVVINSGAAMASSYFKTSLTETMSLTNDTDVLWSKDNTRVTNDLGVNMALAGGMALRTSLLTNYNSDPAPGFKHTDNTLGLSLVYSFR